MYNCFNLVFVMRKKIVVVDIDGTIAQVGDRLKYLQQEPKDWDSFYEHCDEDYSIDDVILLVRDLWELGYEIVYCTGRRESVRKKTQDWLIWNGLPMRGNLLMRKDKDWRHDTEVKPELLSKWMLCNEVEPNDIFLIFEDRDSMVAKWRELGYRCLQVADGKF